MPGFLLGLSSELRSSWFAAAFAVPRLPWALLLRSWSQRPQPSGDHADASGHASQQQRFFSPYKRSIVPDPTSEIVTSDDCWRVMWAWLPEWVTCETPLCVFRASRDGYKCVLVCSSCCMAARK